MIRRALLCALVAVQVSACTPHDATQDPERQVEIIHENLGRILSQEFPDDTDHDWTVVSINHHDGPDAHVCVVVEPSPRPSYGYDRYLMQITWATGVPEVTHIYIPGTEFQWDLLASESPP